MRCVGCGQGSGWGWLGYSKDLKKLVYASTPNQDPLVIQASAVPLLKALNIVPYETS